jgi:alpha-glucuronidase
MKKKLRSLSLFFFCCAATVVRAEDGYRLWTRYNKVSHRNLPAACKSQITSITVERNPATLSAAYDELKKGLISLLNAGPQMRLPRRSMALQ